MWAYIKLGQELSHVRKFVEIKTFYCDVRVGTVGDNGGCLIQCVLEKYFRILLIKWKS